MDDNKENTLADAIAKIETLQAKNESLEADLATANSKIAELDDELSAEKTAHASTKESLAALEAKHRDIDKEVSLKVAEIAAQSGVPPIEADANGGEEESLEELAKKRIDEAQGVEKAKLIESNYDRIMSALKGVY